MRQGNHPITHSSAINVWPLLSGTTDDGMTMTCLPACLPACDALAQPAGDVTSLLLTHHAGRAVHHIQTGEGEALPSVPPTCCFVAL